MKNATIELGDKVEDKITGFKGIVVGITHWLYGCARAIVQPDGITKEGKTYENCSFDVPQLRILKKKSIETVKEDTDTGGPRQTPSAKSTPSRF